MGLDGFIKYIIVNLKHDFFTLHKIEVFHEVFCELVTLTAILSSKDQSFMTLNMIALRVNNNKAITSKFARSVR